MTIGNLARPAVSAVVLAAGLSTRMGAPKSLLPYGNATVIECLVNKLASCTLSEIVVVTGHRRTKVEAALTGHSIQTVFNKEYATGEMLSSVQVGLAAASPGSDAVLIVLSDQPGIERSVVEQLLRTYRVGQAAVVIPSFQMRRGHPLIVGKKHWRRIRMLPTGATLRDYIHILGTAVQHVEVSTPSILRDIDSPRDYEQELTRIRDEE